MQLVGWSMNGPVYREELHARGQSITVTVVLQQIADALGDVDLYIAQQFRWNSFEQTLNGDLLRDYLRHLPDFDDMEAEEQAFA